jgi:hypothetical protein
MPICCRSSKKPRLAVAPTVLDVKHENGQAHGVRSIRLAALGLVLLTALPACKQEGAPEQVADAFVDAYFRRADQEKAKEFTALGVTEMLDKEQREVAQLRRDGYTPEAAGGGDVEIHRGEPSRREQRVRLPYVITVKNGGTETVRDADVELANIGGAWKVVRLGLKQR